MRLDSRILLAAALWVTPAALLARTVAPGPPAARTGLAADGGTTCAACHRTADGGTNANADTRGRVIITVANYSPGVRNRVTVRVEHPDAMRWGFQLTARLESDPTKGVGTFIGNETVFVRCGAAGTVKERSCDGDVEWVNHTAASTGAGTGTGRTWEFMWLAPDMPAGRVIFSAAGLAANNSNNNVGDFAYTATATVEPAAATGMPRPAIMARGVTEALNGGANISSQSWFSIAGTGLAAGTRVWDDMPATTLPRSLGGVSVMVNNRPAALMYVSPAQINGIAPMDDATGMVPVVVTTAGGASEAMMVMKAAAAPALFSPFTAGGRSYVRALTSDGWVGKTGIDVDVRRAARPGETVTVFGSGFGATMPTTAGDVLPESPVNLTTKPTIRLGDTVLTFPGNGTLALPGLFRFDIAIPANTPDGDIALTAETGGVRSSNTVFLTVAR